ncbi:hypothetical protein BLS_002412 [Venturia inaequalis]|nr:hypothetical protein BLS_002412 [Venturia inaequalis]
MTTQGHNANNSHFSSISQASTLRASSSTAATSTSTLFANPASMPSTVDGAANGAPILANNNVLNKRAGSEASLFQICKMLRQRLRVIPECEQALIQEEEDAEACNEDVDPVTLVWRTLRQGYPLLDVINSANPPEQRIKVSDQKKTKRDQAAAMLFITACIREFKFHTEECFTIMDLYGDDTTGFVKVTRVLNRVLDILVANGSIQDINDEEALGDGAAAKGKTQRQHIVEELVKTERTYVHHLELLQDFKKLVEEKNIISGDLVHDIFLNLNALLDFQRRFLIRVEQTNALPEEQQNWGGLFTLYREAFNVYEPYIANTKKCEEIALREFDKLRLTGGPPELLSMVENATVLSSFLLKPFQRLAKYPLLLKELRDKGNLSEERKQEITAGIEAASAVLQRTNEAVHTEERNAAVEELKERVEDWKGHRLGSFGDLLLYGSHQVIKNGASGGKDEERETKYKIYLFQMILLCCKEINPSKSKNKSKNAVDKKGRTRLQLKGRIFMQNVTDTVCQSKPGYYTCQIFWKGDPGIEYFTIKFPAEDIMRKWAKQVDTQRRVWAEMQRASSSLKPANVSDTQYEWLRNQGEPQVNPYKEMDDDDDDDTDSSTVHSGYHQGSENGRNDSSTSLNQMRSRGNTLEYGPRGAAPAVFPLGAQAPLQVRTQGSNGQPITVSTPDQNMMDSYFSPTTESPVSTRSSGQMSMQSMMSSQHGSMQGYFPRQYEEHVAAGRHTAPAIPRKSSRDGPFNSYNRTAANQRPSLPPGATAAQMAQQAARSRSASTPDISNNLVPRTAAPQQPGVPELPPFPQHYAYQSGTGIRTGSPQLHLQAMPIRAATGSPSVAMQQQRMPPPRSIPTLGQHDPYGAQQYPPPMNRTITQIDRSGTPGSIDARVMTPGSSMDQRPQSPPSPDMATPTQLKVKVHVPVAQTVMTLVVPTNITYQSLKDRIDAKLQRSTNMTLSSGQTKLKYMDEGDYISIQSDEDVQMALETWRDQQQSAIMGAMGEVDLYVQ